MRVESICTWMSGGGAGQHEASKQPNLESILKGGMRRFHKISNIGHSRVAIP